MKGTPSPGFIAAQIWSICVLDRLLPRAKGVHASKSKIPDFRRAAASDRRLQLLGDKRFPARSRERKFTGAVGRPAAALEQHQVCSAERSRVGASRRRPDRSPIFL